MFQVLSVPHKLLQVLLGAVAGSKTFPCLNPPLAQKNVPLRKGQEVEGFFCLWALQICVSAGEWPASALGTRLLGESSQLSDILPSSPQAVVPPGGRKAKSSEMDLYVVTVSPGLCLAGWRTLIPSCSSQVGFAGEKMVSECCVCLTCASAFLHLLPQQ